MKTTLIPLPIHNVAVSTALLCMALFASSAHGASVSIEDGLAGAAGRALDGAVVQAFEVAADSRSASPVWATPPAWVASPTIAYASTGFGVTTTKDAGGEFKIPVADQASGLLTLKASVRVQSADWAGLAFLTSTKVNVFDKKNPLLVVLNGGGYVQVLKNGAADMLYSSSPALHGWNSGRAYVLEVRYDRTAGTVDVLVDGNRINGVPLVVGPLNGESIGAVGVRFHGSSIKAHAPGAANFSYVVR